MYTPVLNAKEKARELIDIVRQQTDAPINVCTETVSIMLGALLADLPAEEALRSVRNALFQDDIIDISNCYDAKIMQRLITELTDNIEDKEQQSWTLRDDEDNLVDSLHQLSSILGNADRRVCLEQLRRNDFSFMQRLVALYQIDQRSKVSLAVLKALKHCCELHAAIVSLLLCSNLPVVLLINNSFKAPLNELEIASLELLCALFSTTEKPPFTHYDYFTVDFLSGILASLDDSNRLIMRFILNFNAHFSHGESLVVQALRQNHSLVFGQLLIDELNRRRNQKDLNAVKMILDIFTTEPEIVSTTFYDNDLRVLCDVLCRDLLDTDIPEKMTMILKVLERMCLPDGHGDVREISESIETLLLSEELSDDHRQHAEIILRLGQSH